MDDNVWRALLMALTAWVVGAVARIGFALHSGVRSLALLAIEGVVGGVIGIAAAAFALYWDPSLRDVGWGLVIVGGGAGACAALGTRLTDLLFEVLKRRLGV